MDNQANATDLSGLTMPELVPLSRLLTIAIDASAKVEKIGAPVLASINADSEGATVCFAIEVEGC